MGAGMTEPVTVSVPLDHYTLLLRLLAEAAEDIANYAAAEHPARDQYPSEMRRYNRDMSLVREIAAALRTRGETE